MSFIKVIINALTRPELFFGLAVVALVVIVWKRERVASNAVGYGLLGGLAVFFIFGTFDPNFRLIVTKPDNVPIVGLIFLLAFFVWYSLREAVLNDRRISAGKGPIEKEESDRVWVWPDLVYTELISLILCSVVLIAWSIFLKAPLEQPANPANTPNPSKAPWYFLGLQEMLVYFDPWLAGVVLPGLMIVGLICIPYVDKNTKGNGYFTSERKRKSRSFFGPPSRSSLIVLVRSSAVKLELLRTFRSLRDILKLAAMARELVGILGAGLSVSLPTNWFVRKSWDSVRPVLCVRAAGGAGQTLVWGLTKTWRTAHSRQWICS
jgi:hypothetical protein